MSADISRFTLADGSALPPSPEIEQERNIAIFDLLEANRFRLKAGPPPPYALTLALQERLLVFSFGDETEGFTLPFAPFRKAARAYFTVCESYLAAVRTQGPEEIERLDEGRKALHDEGASLVKERLADHAELDETTARRLFTLIGSLYLK